MRVRRIIDKEDTELIQKRVSDALPQYECEVEIQHEEDNGGVHIVYVYTNIPNDKIINAYFDTIEPLFNNILKELEAEADFKLFALCSCGNRYEVSFYYTKEEIDMPNFTGWSCYECYARSYRESDEQKIEDDKYRCRFCEKEFNKNGNYYTINLEAKIISNDATNKAYIESHPEVEIEKENDIESLIDTDHEAFESYLKAENITEREYYDRSENLTKHRKKLEKKLIHKYSEIDEEIDAATSIVDQINDQSKDFYSGLIYDDYFCSRYCAKKVYQKWINKVLENHFTRECLEKSSNGS